MIQLKILWNIILKNMELRLEQQILISMFEKQRDLVRI